jgi:hypothetical protein
MAERTNARLLKSREVQASVGSNPTPSADSCAPHRDGAGQKIGLGSGTNLVDKRRVDLSLWCFVCAALLAFEIFVNQRRQPMAVMDAAPITG